MPFQKVTDLFTKKIKIKKARKVKGVKSIAPVVVEPISCVICKHALAMGAERVCSGCRYEAKELNLSLEIFGAMYLGCDACGSKHFNLSLKEDGKYRCKTPYGCSMPPRGKGVYERKSRH